MIENLVTNCPKIALVCFIIFFVCLVISKVTKNQQVERYLQIAAQYFLLKGIVIYFIGLISFKTKLIAEENRIKTREEIIQISVDSLYRLQNDDLNRLSKRNISVPEKDSLEIFIRNYYHAKLKKVYEGR